MKVQGLRLPTSFPIQQNIKLLALHWSYHPSRVTLLSKYQPCQILVPQLEEHSRADKCINKQGT